MVSLLQETIVGIIAFASSVSLNATGEIKYKKEGCMFLAGYVFKPDHDEIHFMKNEKVDGRKKYNGNFTTDRAEAYQFTDVSYFQEHLAKFLAKANVDEDHYNFTLTYLELNSGKVTKVLTC